jgi:hypothetical protein
VVEAGGAGVCVPRASGAPLVPRRGCSGLGAVDSDSATAPMRDQDHGAEGRNGPVPDSPSAPGRSLADARFDEVCVGQIGGNTQGFFEFYAAEVLPRLREA